MITEFAPYGDLLGFLRKKRGFKDDYYNIQQLPNVRLTSRQLMTFAWQIADGMAHLSAAKVTNWLIMVADIKWFYWPGSSPLSTSHVT